MADGGEDGIGGVAFGPLEIAAAEMAHGLHVADHGLASTANYLRGYGWQRGQPWNEDSANFEVLKQWNKAEVYVKTLALYADKLQSGQIGKLGSNLSVTGRQ